MTSEVRVFQRKSSVDQSQTWTVTFRNGARESMSVGSNGMTGGLWTIDAVENDDDPNDVTRWVEVFHHSPQQPAPVAEKYVPVWGPEWEYVDRGGRVLQFKRRLKFSVTPAIALTSTDEGDWNYNEDGSFWGARSPYNRDIVSQRPRTPAPVETSDATSQPADVPEVLIGDLTGFDSGDLPPPYSVRMFVDLKGEQRFCLSKVVALVLPWTTTDEELARVKASIIARHAAPVFKELALKRDEYIDVLRKQVDASAAELTTLRERLAGAEEERDEAREEAKRYCDQYSEAQRQRSMAAKSLEYAELEISRLQNERNDLGDCEIQLRADLARAKEDGERMREAVELCRAALTERTPPWTSIETCVLESAAEAPSLTNEWHRSHRQRVAAAIDRLSALAPRDAGAEENHFADAGKMVAELRRQSLEARMRGDLNTADRIAALIGDKLPSTFEKDDLKAQHEEGGE